MSVSRTILGPCKLYDHLVETDQVCRDRMEQIITRMAKAEGINL